MIIFVITFVIALIIILIFFSFPELSPVPYFPSNETDSKLILKALDVKKNQTIVDLGAGDGWVLFAAALSAWNKKLNTQFILLEINPFLIVLLYIRKLFHPNRRSIHILNRNIFSVEMRNEKLFIPKRNYTFYMYLSPRFLPLLTKKIYSFSKKAAIVTYFYSLPKKKPIKTWKGKHEVYKY